MTLPDMFFPTQGRRILHRLILILLLLLGGCRIEVVVPPGGTVLTESGRYTCLAGAQCTIEVNDLFFNETFFVEPEPGFTFGGWRKSPRFFCGGNLSPCSLATAAMEGNTWLESLLSSEEVFYLEPIFHPGNWSGDYGLRPAYEAATRCGSKKIIYRAVKAFTIQVAQIDGHISTDFITGNEVPGAELVSKGTAVSLADPRRFSQRAVYSHPSRGLIDYYLVFEANLVSKVGFSGDYFSQSFERNSGQVCSSNVYLFAERLTEGPGVPELTATPDRHGSFHIEMQGADIICSDGSRGAAPGAAKDINISQSGNLITFDNPVEALVEARTGTLGQYRLPAGARLKKSGDFVANSYGRIIYDDTVAEWTIINGNLARHTVSGTIRVVNIPNDQLGICTETHTFSGYRIN
ncbi:MAG: hypothetical protein V2I26_08675 [Halieaceae bacterium]|nr:hypothetical protein [Halieaceae bacterium]